MDEIQATKDQIRRETISGISALSKDEQSAKIKAIEERLFEFANFLESRIVLLYVGDENEIPTGPIRRIFIS